MLRFGFVVQKYVEIVGLGKKEFCNNIGFDDSSIITGCLKLRRPVPTYLRNIDMNKVYNSIEKSNHLPKTLSQQDALFQYYLNLALNDFELPDEAIHKLFKFRVESDFKSFFIEVLTYSLNLQNNLKDKEFVDSTGRYQSYLYIDANGKTAPFIDNELQAKRKKIIEQISNNKDSSISTNEFIDKFSEIFDFYKNNTQLNIISNKKPANFKIVEYFSKIPSSDVYLIFMYGSLLSPQSFIHTISRDDDIEYMPAKLFQHKVKWGIPYKRKNMIDKNCNSVDVYLQSILIENTGRNTDYVPGAISWVHKFELDKLIEREFHYDLIDITDLTNIVNGKKPKDKIYTFYPQAESLTKKVSGALYVRKNYFTIIQKSINNLGFTDRMEEPTNSSLIDIEEADRYCTSIWKKHNDKICNIESTLLDFIYDKKALRLVGNKNLPIKSCIRPLVLNKNLYSEIKKISENSLTVFTKALKLLLTDEKLKKLSGYREIDFENAQFDIDNDTITPQITRADLAFGQSKINVFEMNCDSPGGMFHYDLLADKQSMLSTEVGLNNLDYNSKNNVCTEIVQVINKSWENYCQRIYKESRPLKTIAIVEKDWQDWHTTHEFIFFKEKLTTNDTTAYICEPDELTLKDDELYLDGVKIDLVYKRVLWNDLIDPLDNSEQALIHSYRNNTICIVNSFGCRMIGNKLIQAITSDDKFEERLKTINIELSDDEKEVIKNNIPFTRIWTSRNKELVKEVLSNTDKYVLKSFIGYGAKKVLIGDSIERPKFSFKELLDKGYIVQKLIPHGNAEVPETKNNNLVWLSKYFILGAYVIDGKCVGIEAKLNDKPPISMNKEASRTSVLPIGES